MFDLYTIKQICSGN